MVEDECEEVFHLGTNLNLCVAYWYLNEHVYHIGTTRKTCFSFLTFALNFTEPKCEDNKK